MAVNHADGMMFTAVFICPTAAGVGAVHAGAGWLTILFVPVGLGVGVGIFLFGRAPIYSIVGFGMRHASTITKNWLQQIVSLPFFLFYMISPIAIVWSAAFAVWAGSVWLVHHMS